MEEYVIRRADTYLRDKYVKWASIELKLAIQDIQSKEKQEPKEIKWCNDAIQELERRAKQR